MSTETPEPTRPQIWHIATDQGTRHSWEFIHMYDRGEVIPEWEEFCIPSMGVWKEGPHFEPVSMAGVWDGRYAAVRANGKWKTVRAFANRWVAGSRITIHLYDKDEVGVESLAFPIDSRMKQIDIDGASHIYKNDDNTGWLFSHASPGEHHDHEINLLSGIDGIMQPMFRQYHVDVITGANFEAKNRAANLFKLLSEFYGEVVGVARTNARAKYLGERHKDFFPETGHLQTEIKTAYEAIKTKWETDRAADAVKLATALTYISNVLIIPTPETRWDREARIEAEKKKAKEATETTSTETPSDGS